jgi:hypothetical protein
MTDFPKTTTVVGRNPQCPLDVDSGWQLSANTGHSWG